MKVVREKIYENKSFFLKEVLRSEDEWANREIAKYKGEEPDPESAKISIEDIDNRMPDMDIADTDFGKLMLAQGLGLLEEHIWEYGNSQQIAEWEDFLALHNFPENVSEAWEDLSIERLRFVYNKAREFVNQLR